MMAPASAATGIATEQAEPRPDAEMHVERRRRIGAEPDIERVAERQLPGKAHHDVPGLPGIGEIENEDEHGEQIVAGEQRRGDQQRQQQRRAARARGAARRRAAARSCQPSCP